MLTPREVIGMPVPPGMQVPLSSAGARGLYAQLDRADQYDKAGLCYWLAAYLDLPATVGEKVDANEVLAAMARFLERSRQ